MNIYMYKSFPNYSILFCRYLLYYNSEPDDFFVNFFQELKMAENELFIF